MSEKGRGKQVFERKEKWIGRQLKEGTKKVRIEKQRRCGKWIEEKWVEGKQKRKKNGGDEETRKEVGKLV